MRRRTDVRTHTLFRTREILDKIGKYKSSLSLSSSLSECRNPRIDIRSKGNFNLANMIKISDFQKNSINIYFSLSLSHHFGKDFANAVLVSYFLLISRLALFKTRTYKLYLKKKDGQQIATYSIYEYRRERNEVHLFARFQLLAFFMQSFNVCTMYVAFLCFFFMFTR